MPNMFTVVDEYNLQAIYQLWQNINMLSMWEDIKQACICDSFATVSVQTLDFLVPSHYVYI